MMVEKRVAYWVEMKAFQTVDWLADQMDLNKVVESVERWAACLDNWLVGWMVGKKAVLLDQRSAVVMVDVKVDKMVVM